MTAKANSSDVDLSKSSVICVARRWPDAMSVQGATVARTDGFAPSYGPTIGA